MQQYPQQGKRGSSSGNDHACEPSFLDFNQSIPPHDGDASRVSFNPAQASLSASWCPTVMGADAYPSPTGPLRHELGNSDQDTFMHTLGFETFGFENPGITASEDFVDFNTVQPANFTNHYAEIPFTEFGLTDPTSTQQPWAPTMQNNMIQATDFTYCTSDLGPIGFSQSVDPSTLSEFPSLPTDTCLPRIVEASSTTGIVSDYDFAGFGSTVDPSDPSIAFMPYIYDLPSPLPETSVPTDLSTFSTVPDFVVQSLAGAPSFIESTDTARFMSNVDSVEYHLSVDPSTYNVVTQNVAEPTFMTQSAEFAAFGFDRSAESSTFPCTFVPCTQIVDKPLSVEEAAEPATSTLISNPAEPHQLVKLPMSSVSSTKNLASSFVAIRPKPPATSHITEKSRCKSPVKSSMRTRSISPFMAQTGIPAGNMYCFPTRAEQESRNVHKKRRQGKTCLRCKFQKLECSGEIPCERCQNLFKKKAKAHSNLMVKWRHCIDLDIMEHNIFLDFNLSMQAWDNLIRVNLIRVQPGHIQTPIEPSSRALQPVTQATKILRSVVKSLNPKAGKPSSIAIQIHFHMLPEVSPSKLRDFIISWLICEVKHESMSRCTTYAVYEDANPSFAWVFAAVVLHSQFLKGFTGLTSQEFLAFSNWIYEEFYKRTDKLLKGCTSREWGKDKENWQTLNEHLNVLYLLSTHHNNQWWMKYFLDTKQQEVLRFGGPGGRDSIIREADTIRANMQADSGNVKATINRQKTSTKGLESLLAHRQQSDKVLHEERWSLLAQYSEHWLQKLQEPTDRYKVVQENILDMNTLCRLDFNIQRKGQRSASFSDMVSASLSDMVSNKIANETRVTFGQSMPAEERQPVLRSISRERSRFGRHGDLKQNISHVLWTRGTSGWPSFLLNHMEEHLADSQVKKEAKILWGQMVKPRRDGSDEAFSSTWFV